MFKYEPAEENMKLESGEEVKCWDWFGVKKYQWFTPEQFYQDLERLLEVLHSIQFNLERDKSDDELIFSSHLNQFLVWDKDPCFYSRVDSWNKEVWGPPKLMLDWRKGDALYILEQNFKNDSHESYKTDYDTDDNEETARGNTL